MLVLTRRVNERIVINGDIVISVLEIGRGGQVRIGIEAPRKYQIYRHEVLLEIQAENRDALAGSSAAAMAKDLVLPRLTPPGGDHAPPGPVSAS
jgi:carbon storage regulator